MLHSSRINTSTKLAGMGKTGCFSLGSICSKDRFQTSISKKPSLTGKPLVFHSTNIKAKEVMSGTRTERTGRKKCYRTGTAQGEGLLQSDFSCGKIQQQVAPNNRLIEPKQILSCAEVPYGDTRIHQISNTTGRLDSIDRPGGRISPCFNP